MAGSEDLKNPCVVVLLIGLVRIAAFVAVVAAAVRAVIA